MPDLDLRLVRHSLRVARKHGFTEVELAVGDDFFTAKLKPIVAPPPAAADTPAGGPEILTINATLVGFYRESKTPLAVGQTVQAGDVVAVIAALGIANDVESKVSGEVIEVLIAPDQPVEYGQPLARVRTV
ncbi:MAG TPA: biotin/lipoyl-containing protein [Fimbriimonas sp.]